MPPMNRMTLRLSNAQREMLEKLSAKLHINPTNIIRIAITDLAEKEGIVLSKRPRS